jgi:hypothetical protein
LRGRASSPISDKAGASTRELNASPARVYRLRVNFFGFANADRQAGLRLARRFIMQRAI